MNAKHEIAKQYILDRLTDAHNAAVDLLAEYPEPEWNDENVKEFEAIRRPIVDLEFRTKRALIQIHFIVYPPAKPVCCDRCSQPIPEHLLERLR